MAQSQKAGEVAESILVEIGWWAPNIQAGATFGLLPVKIALLQRGLSASEFDAGLHLLLEDGLVARGADRKLMTLTESGFARLAG
jgi:hypothetical protein